jgi:preprotein translocase subunit SecE
MNRAVRRQQTKEPKEKPGKTARSAMPRAGTSAKGTAQPRQKGVGGLTPRFALDIISELRKVIWPKREDVVNLTIVIVIVTILIGAALGLIDIGFSWLIDKTLLGR